MHIKSCVLLATVLAAVQSVRVNECKEHGQVALLIDGVSQYDRPPFPQLM